MCLCVYEDVAVSGLDPLSLTRPAFDLRCGAASLLERHARYFAAHDIPHGTELWALKPKGFVPPPLPSVVSSGLPATGPLLPAAPAPETRPASPESAVQTFVAAIESAPATRLAQGTARRGARRSHG